MRLLGVCQINALALFGFSFQRRQDIALDADLTPDMTPADDESVFTPVFTPK